VESHGDFGLLRAQDHSLINICSRMLHIHEGHAAGCTPVRTAAIATMSTVLNVKRRRIYDIVNVLQGLRVTTRSEQGHYRWNGTDHVSSPSVAVIRPQLCRKRACPFVLHSTRFRQDPTPPPTHNFSPGVSEPPAGQLHRTAALQNYNPPTHLNHASCDVRLGRKPYDHPELRLVGLFPQESQALKTHSAEPFSCQPVAAPNH
jgi:hypothetical protein